MEDSDRDAEARRPYRCRLGGTTGAPNNMRTDFTFDYENRLKQTLGSIVVGGTPAVYSTVNHTYDGLGRRIKTHFGGSTWAHVWERCKLLGNVDITTPGSPVNGIPSIFEPDSCKPIASPQVQSSSTAVYYLVSDDGDPARRAYTSDGTAGDTSQGSKYGEYKLINSSGPVYSFFGPRGTQQSELFNWRSFTANANNVMNIGPAGVQDSLGSTMNFAGANEWAPKAGASNSFDFGSDSDFGNTTMGGYASLGMDPTLEWGAGAEPPAPGGCTACGGGSQSSKWLGPGPFTLIPASMKSGDPPKSTIVTFIHQLFTCNYWGMMKCLGRAFGSLGRKDAALAAVCTAMHVAQLALQALVWAGYFIWWLAGRVARAYDWSTSVWFTTTQQLHDELAAEYNPVFGASLTCWFWQRCQVSWLLDTTRFDCIRQSCLNWNELVDQASTCAQQNKCPNLMPYLKTRCALPSERPRYNCNDDVGRQACTDSGCGNILVAISLISDYNDWKDIIDWFKNWSINLSGLWSMIVLYAQQIWAWLEIALGAAAAFAGGAIIDPIIFLDPYFNPYSPDPGDPRLRPPEYA